MLKYYSYYNVGGYKDMFLGDSAMDVSKTYFLPLLPVWEKKAATGDTEHLSKVERVKPLPKIQLITSSSNHGLPKEAIRMFSHGGYKILLTQTKAGETVFAMRDISAPSTPNPFLLAIVGDTIQDRLALEKLTAYAMSHIQDYSQAIGRLFGYDSEANGITFNLGEINKMVRRVVAETDNSITTLSGDLRIDITSPDETYLLLPGGITTVVAIQEQGLSDKRVTALASGNGVSTNNPKLSVSVVKSKREQEEIRIRLRKKKMIIGGSVLLALLLGYLILK